ncbi:hypothetical protein [Sphingobacterium griseoflavum]|uniref:Uncharacterized protein n=1 Tax=Sphingobacterium griseoflavum TaxID=1474952 RepID=A0ABQ3I4J2_9SPHI|nr:hypothetical protein [Sphingobacterium griseoflavum]GHE49215.1 hypothetical protein GCM10017764_35310 [Sphingobacterium griseoflavum]
MELIKRLDKYNLHYGFLEDSDDFSFEVHPERVIIRNDALRANDRTLYEGYLKQKFPDRAQEALDSYDATAANLLQLTKTEALSLFQQHAVNLLCSDISMTEQDAIFSTLIVPDERLYLADENPKEKLIHNKVLPEQVLDRPYIWVDTSTLSEVWIP